MGGLAIKTSSKIPSKTAVKLGNDIVEILQNKNNINSCILGSVGKKLDSDYSGDIDIAVELPYEEKNLQKVYNAISKYFKSDDDLDIHNSGGFKIMSVGIPFDNNSKIAQVDFMFVKSLENAKFVYHSPDYRNNESEFKGASRTDLMRTVISETPVPEEYDNEEYFSNGDLKAWWQFSLSGDGELQLKHKTLQSKRNPDKALKNPVTIKEDTVIFETDPNKIVEYVYGEKCDRMVDLNSFENEVSYLLSDDYKFSDSGELVKNIFKAFVERWGDLPENEKAVKFIKDNGLDS